MFPNGFYLFKLKENFPEKQGLKVFEIDGSLCKTLDQLYDHFELQFDLPAYFGSNWDAFEELLNDLSWTGAKHYAIHISNVNDILVEEAPEELDTFMDIVLDASIQWEEVPNFEGEEEYRKRSGFYIYLLDSQETREWCTINGVSCKEWK